MAESAPRPTQVTIAAWLVMVGSVVVVLTAFDQIAGLRSLETQQAVEEFLSKPPGEDLGLGVQDALSAMRVLTMVAAACATAAALLGFQVLRRSRSARLALTILAGPLFVAGVSVGGFLPAVVVGSIIMLWFQPARDWIDGKAPRTLDPGRAAPPVESPAPPPVPPAEDPAAGAAAPSSAPRPYSGFGTGAPPESDGPPAYAGLPQPGLTHHGPTPRAERVRPPALTWACVLTWVGGALVSAVMVLSVAVVLAAPDLLLDELYRQNPELRSEGFTPRTVRATVAVTGALLLLWSVAAAVVAAFAWRGRAWAWTALLVSACCASALCLVSVLTSPLFLVALGLCAPAVVLLVRPEVRAFVRRGAR